MIIPIELIELLLSKITDNKTILNCRLVNKTFYNYFTPVKLYEKNEHVETVVFLNFNEIKSYFPNGKLKTDYIVNYLGKVRFNEYNLCGTVIQSLNLTPPFKIKKQTINMNTIDIVKYDINKEKETKSHFISNIQCTIC